MSDIVELLQLGFMQRALVAATVVCAVAPLAGVFVVQRRAALTGDGIGHVAFAGVGLAFLVGVHPLLGALALTVLAALALYRMQRAGVGGDLSLALIFYGGIALGFLFASRAGGGVNTILGFLFGSPLNLTWAEVGAIVGLALLVLVLIMALYPGLVAVAFDEGAARASGVSVNGLVLTLTLLVSLTVVGGMYAIGLLLVSAMMVVPVAAAAQVASSYRQTMTLASAIGAGSAVVGLTVAYVADLAPGASIVLIAICCYIATVAFRALRARRSTAAWTSRTVAP
jgi:zinc transport system permease protein